MSRRTRVVAVGVVTALALTALTAATPAWAEPDYPSWSDVQDAKRNEATKRAEIAKIEKLIAGLETEAASFSRAAMERAEEYNQAVDALDASSARSKTLASQAEAAAKLAEESRLRAGQIIAHVARSGSDVASLSVFLSGSGADDLLYRLAALDTIGARTALIYEEAENDRRLASSLGAQAEVASTERTALAAAARTTLDQAEAAAKAAAARTGKQDAVAAQLYEQLAALKGTTSATEKAYLDGVAWEKAQNEIKDPPAPPPPVNPTPPPPVAGVVDGAIAFARSQLGDPYLLNGSGPNAWDCSGLTKASYAAVGVYIGTHSATNQYATMAAAQRLVPYDQLVAGDLLFYSTGGSTTASKYHVTLYIGNGQMIEAPYPGTKVRVANVRYGDLVPYAGRPTP